MHANFTASARTRDGSRYGQSKKAMRKLLLVLPLALLVVGCDAPTPDVPNAAIPTPTALHAVDGTDAAIPASPVGTVATEATRPPRSATPFITSEPVEAEGWSRYRGAWFSIKYPPGFKAKPLRRSSTGKGYDSALFISPDQQVEFYVYAPQEAG